MFDSFYNISVMDRIEFCDMLVKAKERSGIKTSDISFNIRVHASSLRMTEKGVHNFSIKKAIDYLNAFGGNICIAKSQEKGIVVYSYENLLEWYLINRKKSYTKYSFAKRIEYSHVSVLNIETGKCTMSVDTFLKIAEVFGFEISIVNVWPANAV